MSVHLHRRPRPSNLVRLFPFTRVEITVFDRARASGPPGPLYLFLFGRSWRFVTSCPPFFC
jgi:hypothetical protein